jgi:hypothetical protein
MYGMRQKVLSFVEGADLLRDWNEDAAGRQRTTTSHIFSFST